MTHINFAHITLERENVVYTYCKEAWETVYPYIHYDPVKTKKEEDGFGREYTITATFII